MRFESLKKIFRPFYVPILNALHEPKRYQILFQTIRATKPKRIMEIGTWRGDRAIQMITLAQQMSPGVPIEYYGFDLFEAMTPKILNEEISKFPHTKAITKKKLDATGATIYLTEGDTTKLPDAVWRALPAMDFVFIDGGHSKETIASDWQNTEKLMHGETVVIFDDYWPNDMYAGAKPIVDAIDRTIYDVTVLPAQDSFQKPEGLLVIQCAQVRKNNRM